jgi:predicted nucleic acid-binding protein
MPQVYFDSSIFLAVLGLESSAGEIRNLLAELSQSRTKIYTSIITVAECCVGSIKADGDPNRALELIYEIAKVQSVTESIAVATARIEAQMIKSTATLKKDVIARRGRRWDCFHMATALEMQCSVLYSTDNHFGSIASYADLKIQCKKPEARNPGLFELPS